MSARSDEGAGDPVSPAGGATPDSGRGVILSEDDEASIEVAVEEIEGDIALDGRPASALEMQRARRTVEYLRGVLPRVTDEADAAQLLYEIGNLLGWPLDEPMEALEAMRDAYRRAPNKLRLARGFRKACIRANADRELLTALEGEAKLLASPAARAVLDTERAILLERVFDNPKAAKFSYLRALEADETNVIALEAMERIAVAADDPSAASSWAQKHANVVTDAALRAEHLVRAARHQERAGDSAGALSLAVMAQVHAQSSPAIAFAVERLCGSEGATVELADLRERQIQDGIVGAAEGFFDIGVLARYHLQDSELAVRSFRASYEALDPGKRTDKAVCLGELASLLEQERRWEELIEIESLRVELLATGPQRAALWQRMATVFDEQLGDTERAVEAYSSALREDLTFVPALEGAGRLFYRTGSRDRLLHMHRLEAEAASTRSERGDARRRAGEILIQDDATLDEGIQTLLAALEDLPGNLSVMTALERALYKKREWGMLMDLYEHELQETDEPSRRGWLLGQMGMIAADRLDDCPRAIAALKQTLDIGASHPPMSLLRLAELLEDENDLDSLVTVLTRIAEQTPGLSQRASVLQRIASVHERRGAIDDAIEIFRRAIEVAPPSHPVYADAGRAFLRAGRYSELLQVLEAGSRGARPSIRAIWLTKAATVMDRRLSRTSDAIDALSQACTLAPTSPAASLLLVGILTREARWLDLRDLLDRTANDPAAQDAPELVMQRAVLTEAVGDSGAVDRYAAALDAGCSLALLPLLRLAAAAGRWNELEARYREIEGTPQAVLHARYRAGEIASERMFQHDTAVGHLLAARMIDRQSLAPVVALLPVLSQAQKAVEVLGSLEGMSTDPSTRLACIRKRAALRDASGLRDQSLGIRNELLDLLPGDPWAVVHAELALEALSDRIGMADLLRRSASDPMLEIGLTQPTFAALGAVLEQLGGMREAVEAYERSRAASDGVVSRTTLLALRRLYDAVEDDRVGDVLAELAACPPSGSEQALCRRALAWWWMGRGEEQSAVDALDAALKTQPRDYDALNDLVELAGAHHADRVTDALLRAFELEEDTASMVPLGVALAVRLLRTGRMEAARETIDRALARDPGDLKALMLHAEIQERRRGWQAAADALIRVADHSEAQPRLKLEALRRLATIQAQHLRDRAAALGTAEHIVSLELEDAVSLRVRLDVQELCSEYELAAETLELLLGCDELPEAERTELLLRLASLQEEKLGSPADAIETLGRVGAASGRQDAVNRLLALGEQTGRWDLASEALEATLQREDLEPSWEAAIRRRLADLLQSHLGRPDAALRHYERVVDLEPDDVRTLQLLADASMETAQDKAIEYHRRLLKFEPDRVASYRALRQLFIGQKEQDAAFCTEAVLDGLQAANEEESYFYRQRQALHTHRLSGVLEPDEVVLLFPEASRPEMMLLRALEPVLPEVFPVDYGSYGIDDDTAPRSETLGPVASSVGRLLGMTDYRLAVVSPRLRPTVELGLPPLILLPKTLDEALRREQQFVCGALLARVAFGGVSADLCRANALSAKQIELLLEAACHLTGRSSGDGARGAVFEDIKRRLDAALRGVERVRVIAAAEQLDLDDPIDGHAIRHAHLRASARAGILCAQDPGMALGCLRRFRGMFGAGEQQGIATAALEALPFAISAEHMQIRKRLQGGAA